MEAAFRRHPVKPLASDGVWTSGTGSTCAVDPAGVSDDSKSLNQKVTQLQEDI